MAARMVSRCGVFYVDTVGGKNLLILPLCLYDSLCEYLFL